MLRLDYDEISPICGEKTVLVEYDGDTNDYVKLCMKTGYQTYVDSWKTSNPDLVTYESELPQEIADTKYLDGTNVWYRITLQSPNVILYFQHGKWKVSPLDITPSEASSAVPIQIPISPTERALKFINLDQTSEFGENDFEDALFDFQAKMTEIRLKNDN